MPDTGREHGGDVGEKPEVRVRTQIDRLLTFARWFVQEFKSKNMNAAPGVALRAFRLNGVPFEEIAPRTIVVTTPLPLGY